ncbi:MAG: tRNA-dihydrouridine synthase family protein [Nanoarchaeota archaeon]
MTFLYLLAPMEDFTDNAFRALCHKYGADFTFTPMLSIDALAKKNEQTWKELDFGDNNAPVIIQLLGNNEESLRRFLTLFKPSPGFRGFNLNCGCVDPKVIQKGYGCALMKRFSKISTLVEIIKEYNYPVSIKMRLGLNNYEKQKRVYLNLIKTINADFFIIHARHGKETYADKADFSRYKECVGTGKKIIANGDIKTVEQVHQLIEMGLAGVMIGRAAVENPHIFSIFKKKSFLSPETVKKEYLQLAEKYHSTERNKKNILKRLKE